jgi:hypothetical protein
MRFPRPAGRIGRHWGCGKKIFEQWAKYRVDAAFVGFSQLLCRQAFPPRTGDLHQRPKKPEAVHKSANGE